MDDELILPQILMFKILPLTNGVFGKGNGCKLINLSLPLLLPESIQNNITYFSEFEKS